MKRAFGRIIGRIIWFGISYMLSMLAINFVYGLTGQQFSSETTNALACAIAFFAVVVSEKVTDWVIGGRKDDDQRGDA